MFKIGSCEDELFSSMVENLRNNSPEKNFVRAKLAQATDSLDNAANIFEKLGLEKEAIAVTDILLSIAEDIS